MNDSELIELRDLIEQVMYAPTKKEAQFLLIKLEHFIALKRSSILCLDPYLNGKIDQVIAYAKDASGRVMNKEHWISCVDQSWYVFENGIKSKRNNIKSES